MSNHSEDEGEELELKQLRFNYKLLFTVAAGLTPVAYLIGFSFYQGLLSAYGVSSDMFPISTYATYVNFYFAIGSLIISVSRLSLDFLSSIFEAPLASLIILVFFIALYSIFRKIRTLRIWGCAITKTRLFVKRIGVVWSKSEVVKATVVGGFATYLLYTILTVCLALSVFWWMLPLTAFKLGYAQSQEVIEDYIEKGCCLESSNGFSRCKTLITSDGKEQIRGLLVSNSANYVAFYNLNGASVFEFPEKGKLNSLKIESSCEGSGE